MKSSIEKFLDSISRIGSSDDSIYDTLIKEDILALIIKQPDSKNFESSGRLTLSTEHNTLELYTLINQLLSDYKSSRTKKSLKENFKEFVHSLPVESSYILIVDELFGDYFDRPQETRKQLYAPVRNFFYSNICSILFMAAPPLFIFCVILFVYQGSFSSSVFIIITVVLAFVSMLAGISVYDYLNRKIQKYEGVPGAK